MGSFQFYNKNMYCKTMGSGNPKVAIMLHGNMSNHKRWLPLMNLLQKDFHCFALDFPGNGSSEDVDIYHSLNVLADCVEALIADIDAEQFFLFGHSMGGGVAQLTALRNQERVRALVLINSISFKGFHDFYKQKTHIASMYRNRHLLHEIFEQSFPCYKDAAAIEEMVDDAYQASERVFTDEPRAMSEFNLEDKIHLLVAPTLIVHSDGDQIVKAEDTRQMHSTLPNSTCILLESSSHSPHFDDPEAMYKAVMNFINGLGSRS